MLILSRFASYLALIVAISAAIPYALAHEKHAHSAGVAPKVLNDEVARAINARYESSVKPVFQKSCFDCHSSQTKYPWYAGLPGVKQLIASDIQEAKSIWT